MPVLPCTVVLTCLSTLSRLPLTTNLAIDHVGENQCDDGLESERWLQRAPVEDYGMRNDQELLAVIYSLLPTDLPASGTSGCDQCLDTDRSASRHMASVEAAPRSNDSDEEGLGRIVLHGTCGHITVSWY